MAKLKNPQKFLENRYWDVNYFQKVLAEEEDEDIKRRWKMVIQIFREDIKHLEKSLG